ncbi:TSC22 domain family protein 2 isoform X2 [Oryzias latipes]|uniref:TSC22 domain family member 2 n=1 Tax=Oryzias latipes TaxID=8090 RepID=H2LSU1_ORYLA|nr:TSC22 domain family protein 2 isoform X2 [Oryzias latipes]
MSKMPGKRSCFQITSVTQAQVAANCLPDDTESQDDLDESRTGDMPPEGFDVCRVDQGACATNCSEEISHYGGDSLPNKALVNGGFYLKSLASGRLTPGMPPSNFAASSMLTSVTQTAPSNSYSSRFRVIKLDHGTGEPFRRGRWNCTEFYERDSESNLTVDSLKSAVSLDYTDRESVLGATSNSFVSSSTSSAQGLESTTDSGYFASVGHPSHSYHSESQQQDYRLSPRKGSGASAFLPTGYATTLQANQAQGNVQPMTPPTFLSNSLNGVHHGSRQQMPPSIPPASQAQQLDYSAHPTGISDYHQQQFSSGALTSSVVSSSGHVSSPQISSPGPAKRRLGSETGSAQTVIAPIHTQQQPVSQPQLPGGLGIALPLFSTTSSNSGGQNVPVSMPSATSIPQGGSDPMSSSHGAAVHQPEDSRQKVDVLPQHISTVARQDGVRTPITDGFDMQRSTVKNLFNIQISMDVDDDSASGASAVAIDNKIEQAMDLVKSHLMYAVREEVEVLKEQIKELYERNSMLERENAVLKSLANTEQLSQLTGPTSNSSTPVQQLHHLPLVANSPASLLHLEGSPSIPHQPNISSA